MENNDYKVMDKARVLRFISGVHEDSGNSSFKEFVASLKNIKEDDLSEDIVLVFKRFLDSYIEWYKLKYVYDPEEVSKWLKDKHASK